jgi:hypothetical protein
MNIHSAGFLRLAAGLIVLTTLGRVLTGQAAKPPVHGNPLVTDWSHRHLVFSQPATAEGLRFAAEDPRYWQQRYRGKPRFLLSAEKTAATDESAPHHWWQWRHRKLHRDWAEDLGPNGSMGPTNFPAKFSFDINQAFCASDPSPDFVIFPTGLASSGSQASIVAYDNLYSGCSGTKPQVYWAYDTGGQVLTSPTYSLDGSQVAFVQTSGGVGTLVLLKWAASATESVTGPMTLSPVANSAYQTCTAPCMTTLNLQNGSGGTTDDKTSSIFYDYTNDIGWVGGSQGYLHKFTGIFNGTPSEVVTGGFPAQLNTGVSLANAVYDHKGGNVFVEDTDGFLYSVGGATATVTQSGQLDFGGAIADGPIVDSTAQVVYVFASSDGSGNCAGGADCAGVYQLSTTFAAGDTGSEVTVGTSTTSGFSTPNPLYSGAFDSTYLASHASGHLYVCGNTGSFPTLYQVPISAGAMGQAVTGPQLSGSNTPCSPVTDIVNPNAAGGPTEWVFLSTQINGVSTGCHAAGCLYNLRVTPWTPNTTFAQNDEVLDSDQNIEVVLTGGQSGSSTPTWNPTIVGQTTDGGVTWINQETLVNSVAPFAKTWSSGNAFHMHSRILDSNNNIEYATNAGTTGGSVPTWALNVGQITNDGGVLGVNWENLGQLPSSALTASGGTTGIIMDNIVSTGTLAGASQVYFSTLGNETCATSGGTGGCAVQASQPGLQ